ncbi:hypothetical protein ACLOJK_041517 [Asimina triloba]
MSSQPSTCMPPRPGCSSHITLDWSPRFPSSSTNIITCNSSSNSCSCSCSCSSSNSSFLYNTLVNVEIHVEKKRQLKVESQCKTVQYTLPISSSAAADADEASTSLYTSDSLTYHASSGINDACLPPVHPAPTPAAKSLNQRLAALHFRPSTNSIVARLLQPVRPIRPSGLHKCRQHLRSVRPAGHPASRGRSFLTSPACHLRPFVAASSPPRTAPSHAIPGVTHRSSTSRPLACALA